MSNVIERIEFGERGEVLVVQDAAALAIEAAETLIAATSAAVAERGVAAVALSGGSTPKQMGALLAQPAYRERLPWAKTHFFWGDERWVPLEDEQSNAGEAKRGYLDQVGAPADLVHPFETTAIEPGESAARYETLIKATVAGNGLPAFDLVLLGMGDDGHTASLFPGTEAIHERERLVVAHDVPKLAATRLTMTPPLLNAARRVVFLAAGAGKAERLAEVIEGPIDLDALPSQVIRPAEGRLTWFVDRAAAARLRRGGGS
jgi:6-phosphogluconolactonase